MWVPHFEVAFQFTLFGKRFGSSFGVIRVLQFLTEAALVN